MTSVFVDTSFLLALVLTDDDHHERALAWQKYVNQNLITTEYILIELADSLSAGKLRSLALEMISVLRTDPHTTIVSANTQLMDEGLALFKDREDKSWGLTDCISFVVMQQAGIQDALTLDHHFEQAGFRALLRQLPPNR